MVAPTGLAIFWIGIVVIIIALFALKTSKESGKEKELNPKLIKGLIPLACVIVLPILIYFLKDVTSEKKAFYEKALIFTVPFFYLTLSAILMEVIEDGKMRILIFLYCAALFIFQPFINQSFYTSIYKTEFRSIFEKIKKGDQGKDIVFACGNPGWYRFYTKKYDLDDRYVKRSTGATSLEEVMKGKVLPSDPFWIVWGSCNPKEAVLAYIGQLKVLESTKNSTQAFGLLVQRQP